MKLVLLLLPLMLIACKEAPVHKVNSTQNPTPFVDLLNEEIQIPNGMPRKDFLLLAGLIDGEEVQQLSYFSSL